MDRWKPRNKRWMISFVLGAVGISVILLGLILGIVVFQPKADGAHAASAGTVHMSGTHAQQMQVSVLPMHPMYDLAVNMDNAQGQASCINKAAPPLCYSPQQLRQAYQVAPLLARGITGKGRIITIIDAFQDPTIRDELHLFDQMFGLNDPQLNIIAPFGLTPFNVKDPAQTGFAGEIALDVEWAHAIAPGATIDLVLANVRAETVQGQLNALLKATNFAVQRSLGSVISQSFGASEDCLGVDFIQQMHKIFQQARRQKQTVFASAGDLGSAALHCVNGNPVTLAQGVNYPASDPLVSSVGGTTLRTERNGQYSSETVWNDAQQGDGATGGGVSQVFGLPAFQQNIQSDRRVVSDLSLDADPLTGVPVVSSQIMPGQTVLIPIGGTSIGSPVAAGMVALFDQMEGKRLGFLNSALYRLRVSGQAQRTLHDVRHGNNVFVFQANNQQVVTVPGFKSVVGWDPPTGVGTPQAVNMAAQLPNFVQAGDGADL